MKPLQDFADGLAAVLYVESVERAEREAAWKEQNRKLCDEPEASHVHEWHRRRDGSWCACGAIRFGMFL